MDRARLSVIAHRDHDFCNPLSAAKVDRLLGLLGLLPDARVLDVGCGKGEMLVRLVERFQVNGVGVDVNPSFLLEARARASGRVRGGSLTLHEMDVTELKAVEPEPFDATICVGSTHAFGGYRPALRALSEWLEPGGRLLVGEGYWKRNPDPEYLRILDGTSLDHYHDHAGNVQIGVEAGLIPLYSTTSNDDEWDDYEGLYGLSIERHLIEHPEDPEASEIRGYIRRWRHGYLKWGRETLGFGVYLFLKP